jgi:putative GTP pyrophosphokinase
VRAEVQFRTIAMDFWASLEHQLKYKKDIPYAEEVATELKDCAEQIAFLDRRMEAIARHIEQMQKEGLS